VKTLAVLRTSGERTEELAERALFHCGVEFIVIRKYPFIRACEEVFRIGYLRPEVDLLFAIDADIILSPAALKVAEAKWVEIQCQEPALLHLGVWIRDKFRGDRNGIHVYNNHHSPQLYTLFQRAEGKSLRPESDTVQSYVTRNGLIKKTARIPVGLHDYSQWLKDLWRKGLTRAARESEATYDRIIEKLEDQLSEDDEDMDTYVFYQAMLVGRENREIHVDSSAFPALPEEFEEKESMTVSEETGLLWDARNLLTGY
jgi:hypothetical protein